MASWGNGGFNIQYGITQGIALGYGEYLHANIYPALASTYNVCGVYDGTVMKIYLDGILKNNSTYNITAGTSQLYLARFYTGLLPMNGVIHNVLFYNKALNDNEVYYNYSINKVRYMP